MLQIVPTSETKMCVGNDRNPSCLGQARAALDTSAAKMLTKAAEFREARDASFRTLLEGAAAAARALRERLGDE